MRYADINKRFTEIVAEYIGKGYAINTATMGGSQGETAKVDLTNGAEIIRVLIDGFSEWKEFHLSGLEIIVGRVKDDVAPHDSGCFDTIWNSNLEVLYEECFYLIAETRKCAGIYGTKDEAHAAAKLRAERRTARNSGRETADITDKAMEIAKRVIRRKLGVKRIREADIGVYRYNGVYDVVYRGKTYRLH